MAEIEVTVVVERVETMTLHYSIGEPQATTHEERQRVVDVNGEMIRDGARGTLRAAGRLEDGDTVRVIRARVVPEAVRR